MADFFNNINEHPSKFQQHGTQFTQTIREEHYRVLKNDQPCNFQIRNYQTEAVLKTRIYFDDLTQPVPTPPALIVAPTGCGKSGMVAMLPYVLGSQKVLILSPAKIISQQLAEAFGHYTGIKSFFQKTAIGNVPDDRWRNFHEHVTLVEKSNQVIQQNMSNLVIVNAQKFGGNANSSLFNGDQIVVDNVRQFFQQFDTLIVDEAHHYPARTWQAIVKLFEPPKKIVFLTATPFTGQGKAILPNQQVTFRISREEIEGIWIRRCNFQNFPASLINVPNGFEHNEEFCNQLHELIRFQLLQHDTQANQEVCHQAMILVRLSSEATSLANTLNRVSGDANFARGVIGDKNGEEYTTQFKDGAFKVAIICKKLLEGFDNNNVSVCVIIRNVKSQLLFNQFIGRCVRMSEFADGRKDVVNSQVITFERYRQDILWNNRDMLAEDDPEDEPEEED